MFDVSEEQIRKEVDGKSILITGGTGSFGSKMFWHLVTKYNPRRVAVFSRSEHKHYELGLEVERKGNAKPFRSFIGDVRDKDRLAMAMRGVDLVIHAAALKQVTIAEYNPFECIHTNVMGAQNVVQAAVAAGVPKVVALSTDKAVNPINLYGASKLASDKIFVGGNALSGSDGTRFCVVRYGNVVGSQGSVIPYFRKLLADGVTELPITHAEMTRFWITLDEAVEFVLASAVRMRGGEIFVPKIPSMKITDLAEAMAPGVAQKIVGIRPGEKLHEMMITEHNARHTVDLGHCYAIEPEWVFWSRTSYRDEGAPLVADGFEYVSNTNDQWTTADEMRAMLETIP